MAEAQPTKVCSKCRTVKPVEAFGVESRQKDGRRAHCRTCGNTYRRTFCKSRPDYRRSQRKWRTTPNGKRYKRREKLRRQYGLTEADYAEMLTSQGGRCAICNTDKPGGQANVFVIDHCHASGRVRGLLCNRCNRLLGVFDKRPELLPKIVSYRGRNPPPGG